MAFAAVSVKNGKVFNVKRMSRYCKGWNLKKSLKVKILPAYVDWKKGHVCRYNYKDSTSDTEAEGAKRIFEFSINKRKLSL